MTENKEQVTEPSDPTEVLEPSVADNMVTIGKDDYEMIFIQKPLSFFGKMDFFSVLGRALDRAMSGPDGVSVADLLDVPDRTGGLTPNDFKDADLFVKGVAKIASYTPEILGDLYCVILAVPRGQRMLAKEIMELNESDGGFSDEQGIGILTTFVEQNWEVMQDFFKGQIAELANKIGEKMAPESPSSKPSKATRQNTRKQSKN